jgi:3-oxoacyl-[acyl-carrier-protein] synthase-3
MNVRLVSGPLRLLGDGAALPGPPVPTDELLHTIDDRFGIAIARQGFRVADRLGIRTRHFSRDFLDAAEAPRAADTNPKLCARALRQALTCASLPVQALGYLLAHTTTPHTLLPPNVAWVADELDFGGLYLELRQACCGFANALQIAAAFLAAPEARPVAIVGSETGSVFLDPRSCARDHGQLVNLLQMGDGAGAAILAPATAGSGPELKHLFFGSLGPGRAPGIRLDAGGSSCARGDHLVNEFRHDFQRVRAGGLELFQAGADALSHAGVYAKDVDWILTHQASAAIPRLLAPLLGVDPDRFIIDCDPVGNLGSASIWVALHRLRAGGRLRDGQSVMVLGAEASKYLYGGFIYRHFSQAG